MPLTFLHTSWQSSHKSQCRHCCVFVFVQLCALLWYLLSLSLRVVRRIWLYFVVRCFLASQQSSGKIVEFKGLGTFPRMSLEFLLESCKFWPHICNLFKSKCTFNWSLVTWQCNTAVFHSWLTTAGRSLSLHCESKKNPPPYAFLKFFPKWLGIFNQFFTHLLYDQFYTRVQIFI